MTASEDSVAAAAVASTGVVELREDLPLKAGSSSARVMWCAAGPRLVLAGFVALSAAITLALFTQIYCGDFEVIPHGGVSSDAAACSQAGTRALKDGGRALDAAAVTALCLAVLAPHRTSLDASGSLLYWEYRQARSQLPTLAEWGSAPTAAPAPPRLLAALAALHAQHGTLPWRRILQPAIDLAKNGFPVSESLAAAGVGSAAGTLTSRPRLAAYLRSLQRNTSAELSAAWGSTGAGTVDTRLVQLVEIGGGWRLAAGGLGAEPAARALLAARTPPPLTLHDAETRVVAELRAEAAAGGAWPGAAPGGASGLAAADARDTYVALVAGLSTAFGSGPPTADGWRRDAPTARLDLAPAILLDERVCGTRYVLASAGGGAALAQAAAVLAAGAGAAGVERARRGLLAGGVLAPETLAAAAVNVVQQRVDALLTHADSRGGGLASRF